MSITKEEAQQKSKRMGKEMDDTIREQSLDENRLNERCQYRIQYEPYSWCDLSDNICLEDSGNSDFDTICENNTARLEEKV